MRVIYSTASQMDLLEIGGWIAQENHVRAESFVEELRNACEALTDFPRAYPVLFRRRGRRIRRKPHHSYLIFYAIKQKSVEILRVVHGARDHLRLMF